MRFPTRECAIVSEMKRNMCIEWQRLQCTRPYSQSLTTVPGHFVIKLVWFKLDDGKAEEMLTKSQLYSLETLGYIFYIGGSHGRKEKEEQSKRTKLPAQMLVGCIEVACIFVCA